MRCNSPCAPVAGTACLWSRRGCRCCSGLRRQPWLLQQAHAPTPVSTRLSQAAEVQEFAKRPSCPRGRSSVLVKLEQRCAPHMQGMTACNVLHMPSACSSSGLPSPASYMLRRRISGRPFATCASFACTLGKRCLQATAVLRMQNLCCSMQVAGTGTHALQHRASPWKLSPCPAPAA